MATKKRKRKRTVKKPLEGWRKEGERFVYHFKDSIANRYNLKKITFIDFDSPPAGLQLYRSGGGFNNRQSRKVGGDLLFLFLKEKYDKRFTLTVYKHGTSGNSFTIGSNVISIRMSFSSFFELLQDLGTEVKTKRDSVIQKRLSRPFFREFSTASGGETTSSKLGDIDLNDLKDNDHTAIAEFFKRYISLNSDNKSVQEKLQKELVIQGKKKTLEQVIRKYERHIANKKYSEKKWQKFLHEEVFFFNTNYIQSIREANVNFGNSEEGAKKPDFVWIDIYGFLDVFEIKTPQTDILSMRLDDSHKNYYFSKEAAKAIAQIEKYILFLERNVENFEKYMQRQTKIPFSVLKPKAFLVIGRSKEFERSDQKKKDFRILRRLFKNIEFITFDELLDNLKNLESKFEKEIG